MLPSPLVGATLDTQVYLAISLSTATLEPLSKAAPVIFPDTLRAPVLAFNDSLVVETLANWAEPAAPTITGYKAVVVMLLVAVIVLLPPELPAAP